MDIAGPKPKCAGSPPKPKPRARTAAWHSQAVNKPSRAARSDTRLRRTAAHRYMAAVSKARSVAAEKSLAKIIRAV